MSFKRFIPRVKEWDGPMPSPRSCAVAMVDTRARMVVPVEKSKPLRSEPYRRWVASLRCAHCPKPGPSQCAHSDEGKGLSLKASDATCFPLCADSPGRQGCHSLIGASGLLTQSQRRALEAKYSAETYELARELGKLPKGWA